MPPNPSLEVEMILMSPTDDLEQTTPVTTTYAAPESNAPQGRRADRPATEWKRVEVLFAFCRERARDRLREARNVRHRERAREERRNLAVLQTMFDQARKLDDHVVTSCAVSYFRALAMRDAHHREFRGEWITPRLRRTA